MTTEITTATVASTYELAFNLNLDEARAGEPCRAAFRSAHDLLCSLLGEQRAGRVHERVTDCAEYDVATLDRLIAEVTPKGCKCEHCVKAHLNGERTPLSHGTRTYGDVRIQWAVFTEEQVKEAVYADDESLASVLTDWYARRGGPGELFAEEPELQRGKYHTLVTQRCGLNV